MLIADGKVAAVGAGGLDQGAGRRDRHRRPRQDAPPGLWDSHQHVGDDWNLLQNVATGMTNYRSPGTMIDEALSIYKRRAAGDLLAPDGKISVIVDRKDPLAAQGALTVSVRRGNDRRGRQDQGRRPVGRQILHLDESGVDRAGARPKRTSSASTSTATSRPGMRPLDAVRAGYDEVTHINFIMMQAMPQDVVDKANTAARLEGPAKYGKDVDLDSPAMKAFYAELVEARDDHRPDADGVGAADDLGRQHDLARICAVCRHRPAGRGARLEDRRLSACSTA